MAPGASGRSMDLLCVHLAVAGFGFAGLFGKFLALSPVTIVAGRAGFAALSLAVVLGLRGRWREGNLRWGTALPLGALLAVHWWAFFQSIHVATVAIALVSFSSFPILVVGAEAFLLRKWPRMLDLAAGAAALLGIGVIVPSWTLADQLARGVAWGLLSGATFAAMVMWNRRSAQTGSPWVLAMAQNGVAFLVLLPLAWIQEPRPVGTDWLWLAVLGSLFTAGTHGLFIQGLRTVPSKLASLICTLEPAYGILASSLLLREVPSAKVLLGALVITAAVAAVSLKPDPAEA